MKASPSLRRRPRGPRVSSSHCTQLDVFTGVCIRAGHDGAQVLVDSDTPSFALRGERSGQRTVMMKEALALACQVAAIRALTLSNKASGSNTQRHESMLTLSPGNDRRVADGRHVPPCGRKVYYSLPSTEERNLMFAVRWMAARLVLRV